MALIIENQSSITPSIFKEWRKSNHSASYKKTIRIFTIIMAAIFVGVLAWFYSNGISPITMLGELLFMLAIYLWVTFLLPRSTSKRLYKSLCKKANGTPKRTVRFYSDYFTVTTESGNTRDFSYDKIHAMKETEHLYVLVNESNIDIILDKNGFIFGSIDQVKEFLPDDCEFLSF